MLAAKAQLQKELNAAIERAKDAIVPGWQPSGARARRVLAERAEPGGTPC